ncbi:Gfo/Idh/MocA family protein [Dolichospermum flos-aquae]|uniref:Gfo/Idh/MocA family oxidoreductase n=1 Tax=Dolichospermum flos-aquae LEGE 04289 TaxID=1828708 RepID=A0ACC5Q5A2_DOLFA|nr:Gfo/Idh/MocA family oxidoreductase [Dolichospermum flos-aquae]MBE9219842.1 Gfo/Idh/MocA family oxidoreductase [Dolichospermum flos-aquae LEGE 04289]
MYNHRPPLSTNSLRVGLVGTGYAAKLRAEALRQDPRSDLIAIAGNPQRTAILATEYATEAMSSWQQLVEREDLDLVVLCTINQNHGKIARAALERGKHVIVEYPLAVDVKEAEELIILAKTVNKLLHVEHIELLGGWHQTLKQHLYQLGDLFYVTYSTLNPQHPAPCKWTYNHEMFGFPLIGALSRLNRLIDLFGEVFSVNCHQRYWQIEPNYYQTCFCSAQLCFDSGLLAQVVYGKGETLWQSERKLEVHGENGGIILDGDTAMLILGQGTQLIEMGTRRGLFAKDTTMVLDYLFDASPLYITPEQSLYALKVADATYRAATTGLTVFLKE